MKEEIMEKLMTFNFLGQLNQIEININSRCRKMGF